MMIHKALQLLLILSACPAAAQMQLLEQKQWPYQSVITDRKDTNLESPIQNSAEQHIRERLKANEERKEQQQKRLFDADKKRWSKCFGHYQYDWQNWKKAANGTWVTDRRFGCTRDSQLFIRSSLTTLNNESVAVTCKGLKISTLGRYSTSGWSEWKDPDSGDSEMLVKLCSREEQ